MQTSSPGETARVRRGQTERLALKRRSLYARREPFTLWHNATGIIDAQRVLTALDRSGAQHVKLILELIPPFEQDEGAVVSDLRESCKYWRAALAAHARG